MILDYLRSMAVQPISWAPDGAVRIVDQRALPHALVTLDLDSVDAVADAIRTLAVRGAPLIGIAAAMGLVAGLQTCRGAPREAFLSRLAAAARQLGDTRPTAVNLRWALDRMTRVAEQTPGAGEPLWLRLQQEAAAIWDEDREMCARIGANGLALVPEGARVLTHCNAGALATGGVGTALAPLYAAHAAGRRLMVYVDETRPLLQGARLTAWELGHAGIPHTLIADAAAAAVIAAGRVDLVIVGADRIAANGDVANKIGTYGLAVVAVRHGVPLYVAAPRSTIDPTVPDGAAIPMEQRAPDEVTMLGGRAIAPAGAEAYNPAFDVTPAALVTAYVTDRGVEHPPFA
jgi:methylthioribose-1-phosphate isomerase